MSTLPPAGPHENSRAPEARDDALRAAIILRDCSLRTRLEPMERDACRQLMRQAAFHWRKGANQHAWCG